MQTRRVAFCTPLLYDKARAVGCHNGRCQLWDQRSRHMTDPRLKLSRLTRISVTGSIFAAQMFQSKYLPFILLKKAHSQISQASLGLGTSENQHGVQNEAGAVGRTMRMRVPLAPLLKRVLREKSLRVVCNTLLWIFPLQYKKACLTTTLFRS